MRETLGRMLPGVRHHARDLHGPLEASPGLLHDRWIADTIDRMAVDVTRRFSVAATLVSVLIGEREWFRVHVNVAPRPLPPRSSHRTWSFVRQVVEGREPIVVPDVMQHPVFAKAEAAHDASTPVESGPQETTASVTVTYELR